MIELFIVVFLASCFVIFWTGNFLIEALMRAARFLGWREFIVAFFVMAVAGSVPNLFVGLSAVLEGIPELSFGDIVGGNLVDLTVVVALATLLGKEIKANSRLIQVSAAFTVVVAILPLLLILDGTLGRGDGIILLLAFWFYIFWVFSKKERFTKLYDPEKKPPIKEFKVFMKDVGRVVLGIFALLIAAEGIVESAHFFAVSLSLPISLIGILVVGLGNALPETYFAVVSARRGETWMILGDLMGAVVVGTTFVLGTVGLLMPIQVPDISSFLIARVFLVIAAAFFLFFVRSDRRITNKEALFLLGIYVLFVLLEILVT